MKAKNRALLGQLSDTDLRLLRVFRSVVACGGLSAAELELNIATSTISRHIKNLEIRLGLTICRRGRGGFSLTPEGQQVYNATLALLRSVENFRGSVDEIHQNLGGQLVVGVFDKTAGNPNARIGEAIARFVEQAPAIDINLHVATINVIERGVIDGTFHLGIIPAHRTSESLAYGELFKETMLLYCGFRHPLFKAGAGKLSWAKLRKYSFAGLGYHSPNMELSHRVHLRRSATGFDQEAIATFILSGKYLGFLPDHYGREFEKRKSMRAIQPSLFKYDCNFVMISRRSPAPSRAAELFMGCLQDSHARGGQ